MTFNFWDYLVFVLLLIALAVVLDWRREDRR